MKISDVDLYFGKIITCLKIENSLFYVTHLQLFHKSYTTAVSMAKMTSQDGGYFGFEVYFDREEHR